MCRSMVLLILAVFVLPRPAEAADDVQELLKYLPDSANAMMIIRVEDAYKTPLGQREEWARKHLERYQGGTGALSPSVETAVLAAQLEPQTLRNAWEIGLLQLRDSFTLEQIAQQERGQLNTLAGQQVAWSPRDFYAAQLAPNRVGVLHPANRQVMSRWLNTTQGGQGRLSPYLRQAATRSAPQTPILMALDLTDMLEPKLLRLSLSQAKALEGKKVDFEELIQFVAGLKGLTLTVRIDTTMVGELRLDFSQSPEPFKSILKPLLLEALSKLGAAYYELDNWELTLNGNSCRLRSRLTEQDVRQIMSLVHPPLPPLDTPQASPGEPSAQLKASLRYHREVTSLVNALETKLRDAPNYLSYETSSIWHDTFAKQIEQLPIMNVDPDLVQYGASMGSKLRTLAVSLKGNKIDKSQLEAAMYRIKVNYGYGYGYMGGSYYYDNYYQINQALAKVRAEGAKARLEIWQTIDEETAALRRKMTLKYGMEF